jgi:hypothetical protein
MRRTIVAAALAAIAGSLALGAVPASARIVGADQMNACRDAAGRVIACDQDLNFKQNPDTAGYVTPPTLPPGKHIPPFVGPTPEGGSPT